jgi:hypothetical protein
MRLMLFARDLIESILDGTEPEITTLDRLLASFPNEWRQQRAELLGLAKYFSRAKKDD